MRSVGSIALAGALALAGLINAQDLRGVVDLHAHSDPDTVPRSVDAIEAARLMRDRGFRAVVLKNHYEPTASLAYIVRKAVPGIEVFGGIALNRSVGGINPAAVERLAKIKGGYARIVWMPTFDAENQVRYTKENRPFVAVSRNGELLPEVREVMRIIARDKLTLATGHSSAAEILMLIREAKAAGVERIIVTHALYKPISMTVTQMREAARMGAKIEFPYNLLIGAEKSYGIAEYARAIRDVGPENCFLSSDLGQAANPLHADGFAVFLKELAGQGFTTAELDLMSKRNPAWLIGLKPE